MRKALLTFVFCIAALLAFQTGASAASVGTTTGYVHFRTAASIHSTVMMTIPKSKQVTVIDKVNRYWVKVSYSGKTGYISTNYVSYSEPIVAPPAPKPEPVIASKAQKVVDYAESLQGKVTYSFGVNNPSRLMFDCSSYTKYVFKQAVGVDLIWGAAKQATQGFHVSKANLKPGDLVHFTVGTSTKIGHVGIYIGNGKFINNLPHVGVVISNLNSSYWTRHYVTATRII